MKGLTLTVSDGYYGTTDIKYEFDLGEFNINCGPTSYIYFFTDRSYYKFDEEIYIKGLWFNSDITLKKDISKIKDSGSSMEKLKKLEGLTYKFKEDKDDIPYAGFSAQELQKILPDLVFEDEEGLLSVNYIGLIPYLLEAIKEQESRISELELLLIKKDKLETLK